MSVARDTLPYLDSHTREFIDDPNSVLGTGPDRIRVARGRIGTEFFSFDAVRAAFRDSRLNPRSPQLYIDKGVTGGPILDYLVDGNLSLTWPAYHERLRPLMVQGFRPHRIRQARDGIRATAGQLIADLRERGGADIVTEFSHLYSITVISSFIGIPPQDVPEFEAATLKLRLLGQEPFWPGVPELEAALDSVRRYSERIVEQRRQTPCSDMISDLIAIQAEVGDQAITKSELIWQVAGVLLAGHDTTRYQMASAVRAVVEAGQWEQLAADPAQIPAAVDEALRLYPSTPRQVRVATEAMALDGTELAPGDVLTINMTAAGRDPNSFPAPDELKLDRTGLPRYDIGFGYGNRLCLGYAVARAELEIGLEMLTSSLTDVELGDIDIAPTGVIAGPEHLQIRYRARG